MIKRDVTKRICLILSTKHLDWEDTMMAMQGQYVPDRVLGLIREQSGIWCYEVTSNNTVYEQKLLYNRLISRLIVLGSLIVITVFFFYFSMFS